MIFSLIKNVKHKIHTYQKKNKSKREIKLIKNFFGNSKISYEFTKRDEAIIFKLIKEENEFVEYILEGSKYPSTKYGYEGLLIVTNQNLYFISSNSEKVIDTFNLEYLDKATALNGYFLQLMYGGKNQIYKINNGDVKLLIEYLNSGMKQFDIE